ncbi:hypothetical protein AB0G02_30425, partial [Actinosynnema sp. NPDC023658]|uniref:hypothetical protein n=1 Tax=Actinosynnema sp. NPDC023658 TaxID=3155465 RepID=UPI0033DC29F1
ARQPDRAGGEGAPGNPRKDRAAVAPVLLPDHVDTPTTPPVDEDVVPVIDLDVEEDTSAWGATGAVGLLWGASKATRRDDDDEPVLAPDHALRDNAPWLHSSSTAVRVQPSPGTRPRDGSSVPKPYFPDDDMPMAGDQEMPEEVEEVVEPEADEEAERTASDLLKQDERVWGAPAPRVPGVIE